MVSLISCILSWLRGPARPLFYHPWKIPCPSIVHMSIEEDFLKNFKEVFVIGDVHGCYDELVELLNHAEVNGDSSLKIFVGDIVNKGPKNQEVIELVRNSNSMLSVRGNHDEVVLREYFSSQNEDYELKPQNKWIKKLKKEDIDYLKDLPYTISISSLNVIIVHAGINPAIPLKWNTPADLVTMRNLVIGEYFGGGGVQATKQGNIGEPWAKLWPGPAHIYFGHDAKRLLQREAFATGLDTGCVYGGVLTGLFISGPKKGTFVTVKAMKAYKPIANA